MYQTLPPSYTESVNLFGKAFLVVSMHSLVPEPQQFVQLIIKAKELVTKFFLIMFWLSKTSHVANGNCCEGRRQYLARNVVM